MLPTPPVPPLRGAKQGAAAFPLPAWQQNSARWDRLTARTLRLCGVPWFQPAAR